MKMVAEREGFEPPEGYKPSTVFKTAALNHSATSPQGVPGPRFGHDLGLPGTAFLY